MALFSEAEVEQFQRQVQQRKEEAKKPSAKYIIQNVLGELEKARSTDLPINTSPIILRYLEHFGLHVEPKYKSEELSHYELSHYEVSVLPADKILDF
jgi:hypothetical protein